MSKIKVGVLALCLFFGAVTVHAQSPAQTAGVLVIVPGIGEVKHTNDEARVTLMIEEQDQDKAAAASRVNQKMKQGMEIIKKEDPSATLKTRGYYTYPVYSEDQPRQNNKAKQPASWRVGHFLEVTTTNLTGLPKTVAAAQRILALNNLHFGLSESFAKEMDKKGIEASYQNLTERVSAIAKAMGRNTGEAVYESLDFEGAYAQPQEAIAPQAMRMRASSMDAVQVEEPSFEPGETTVRMRVVGKVRFK
jgi:uncharacterized protein